MAKRTLSLNLLNQMAEEDAAGLVKKAEERYETRLEQIADRIAQRPDQHKIILLSGPSSSGKTTTSGKLQMALKRRGVQSITVSLDNFFKNRDDLPFLPDGSRDFETIRALDMETLHGFFWDLLLENRGLLPHFDFVTGKRQGYEELAVTDEDVVIAEGIHAMHPALTEGIQDERFFHLYVSVKTEIVCNEETVLSSRNLRLIRRLIRDYFYRGSSPENTLAMWPNVLLGEEQNLKPYMDQADGVIDTIHAYEPMVYRQYFPLLMDTAKKESKSTQEKMEQLWNMLNRFASLEEKDVPKQSLIREFLPDAGEIRVTENELRDLEEPGL